MSFGDILHSAQASASDTVSPYTVSVTITSPTSGSLLVVAYSWAAGATLTAYTTPSGWTPLTASPASTATATGAWFYKISDGTETSVVGSADGAANQLIRGAYVEIEGPFAASPLDVTAENEANLNTFVASEASGTTATTAQGDECLVVFFSGISAQNIDGGRAYSNSFVEAIFASATLSTARPGVAIATLVVSTTGAYSCTYTTTDAGDKMYGAIATFNKQVSSAVLMSSTFPDRGRTRPRPYAPGIAR